jgi:molybdenum cofactor biosynthesis protein B
MQRKQVDIPHKIGVNKTYEIAIISISTSRFMKYGSVKTPEEAEDKSGRIIIDLFGIAGHKLHSYTLISDEEQAITRAVKEHMNAVNVIITTGGTGLSPRDVTIEAIQQLFQKELPGFGELFRFISYEQIGSSAMLTRASSGIIDSTAIFCLPGSPNAVKLAMEALILPELQHVMLHVAEH